MEITPAELSEIVEKAVKRAFKDQHMTCSCGLSAEAQKEVPHFFGAVKDIGGGSHSAGVEKIRESVKFVDHVRTTSRKVSTTVAIAIILSLIGGAGFIFKTGFKTIVGIMGGK